MIAEVNKPFRGQTMDEKSLRKIREQKEAQAKEWRDDLGDIPDEERKIYNGLLTVLEHHMSMKGEGHKMLTDLPEHALEEIVTCIAKNKKDLNMFFAFGLSSKLFHKPTIHVLDKNDVYFPIDMNNIKTKSNVTMMKYMALYDEVSKGKFGLKFLTKQREIEPQHGGCKCCGDGSMGDGRVGEWLNECKGLRKVYLDKVNVSMPIMKLALQRLIYQSHESIQVLKFENDGRFPHALDDEFFNRCIRGCESLKELVLIWRLNRTMEHERALDFKHGVFKIIDNMPDLEILRIEMPQIVGDKGQEYKNNGEFRYNIVILDLKLRFFYEETMFTPYMTQIVKSTEESKNRKLFSFNGELMHRKEECAVHGSQSSEEEEDKKENEVEEDEKENEEQTETSSTEEERIKQEENEEKRLKTLKNWW
jgi:hypothetical protein